MQGERLLFLVKARVHASMKSTHYTVYVHLDQATGDAVYAKCNCNVGQGGYCKHAGALLYNLLDYVNMGATEIPETRLALKLGINDMYQLLQEMEMTFQKHLNLRNLFLRRLKKVKREKDP